MNPVVVVATQKQEVGGYNDCLSPSKGKDNGQ